MSGMPEFCTHPTPLADLGVLFVHGIGRQRYGECLMRSASPVCEALIRWAVSARPSSAADNANEELAAAVSPISAKSPGLPATVTLTICNGRTRRRYWPHLAARREPVVRSPDPSTGPALCAVVGAPGETDSS